MKLNRYRHFFSTGGQILAFIRKFYEGKNRILVVGYSYLFCQYEISQLSQKKIITSFKFERMSLNLLATWPKHKIEIQIIYDDKYVHCTGLGIRVSRPDYRKMEHGKHSDGVYVVKTWKPLCQKGGNPSFKLTFIGRYIPIYIFFMEKVVLILSSMCKPTWMRFWNSNKLK